MTDPRDQLAKLADRVEHDFTYHRPRSETVEGAMTAVRNEAKTLAHSIVNLAPLGREQSLALTHLEQAVMWAVAGMARNQEELAP